MKKNSGGDITLKQCNFKFETVKEYKKLYKETHGKPLDMYVKDYKAFVKKHRSSMMKSTRKVVFTIHNPFKYYDSIKEIEYNLKDWKGVKRAIFSLEVGKSGASLHIQGFIEFKTKATKATLLNKLRCADIHIEDSKGSLIDNYNYITKIENRDYDKPIFTIGDGDTELIERDMMTVSDFVDFALRNKIKMIDKNFDKYCMDFRRNPITAKHKIAKLYNVRKHKELQEGGMVGVPSIVITGLSGAGKSILSNWMIRHSGILHEEVFKLEANAHTKKIGYTKDCALKRICYFSEVNAYFPNKTNLLSLLDGESKLEVKGSDSIVNSFEKVIINTTNLSLHYIYNVTQKDQSNYQEITRRINQGYMYIILPHEKGRKSNDGTYRPGKYYNTVEELLEDQPPTIFKVNLSKSDYDGNPELSINSRSTGVINTFTLNENNTTVVEKYGHKYYDDENGLERSTYSKNVGRGKIITKERMLKDFQNVKKLNNK